MVAGPPSGEGLKRKFHLARAEAALTDTATALLIGGTGIAAVLARVAETRDLLNPGTWAWVLLAGGVVTAGKIALDLRDRRRAGAVWRKLLVQSFGPDMRADSEASRLARVAIEFRVRLAEAEAVAPRDARARVDDILPRLDTWVELIVALAREVAGLRGEARFQSGLATRVRSRLAEIEGRLDGTDRTQRARLLETARALSAQVRSFDAFNAFVDDGALRLEHAVGAFSAAVSQIVLELSRGQSSGVALNPTMVAEIDALERMLSEYGSTTVPQLTDETGEG
jgi:hypothetical protein